MRVEAKNGGVIFFPQPDGQTVGLGYNAGDQFEIPEAYFNEALFTEIKPVGSGPKKDAPAQKKTKQPKRVKKGEIRKPKQ